jgi:hypothetical protein
VEDGQEAELFSYKMHFRVIKQKCHPVRESTASRGEEISNSHTPPLVEEVAPFHKKQKSRKEQKYGHGFQRDPKPTLTVLARTSSSLPNQKLAGVVVAMHFDSQKRRRNWLILRNYYNFNSSIKFF